MLCNCAACVTIERNEWWTSCGKINFEFGYEHELRLWPIHIKLLCVNTLETNIVNRGTMQARSNSYMYMYMYMYMCYAYTNKPV